MPEPRVELLLARHADTAWHGAIRPWLEGGHGQLTRSYVVVPTRGQAQGLKQRCVTENLALLGVEFLTPGLARQKWLPLAGSIPVLGRELLLFELRVAITQRLQVLEPGDTDQGLLKSLLSDAERALDDFDELVKAGFGAEDFLHPVVGSVFKELEQRVEALGYVLGARQSAKTALSPVSSEAAKIGGRLLIYGLSAEAWGEFFNVAAFVRRFDEVSVVLPEPEFRGQRALDEAWVEVWQAFLGVNPLPIDAPAPEQTCEPVAAWWIGAAEEVSNSGSGGEVLRPRILVGRTRTDEMRLVADEVVRLLDDGAEEISVVFPKADAAHARLGQLLTERAVPFVDLLPGVGATSLESQTQRALFTFYEKDGRLEDLLELWPLLVASGFTEVSMGKAREVCERLFDERQTHALTACVELLAGRTRPEWREVQRIASLLLPAWPDELTLADALTRYQAVCERLVLALPAGWSALAAFAERETRVLPVQEVLAALASFIPKKSPATSAAVRNSFARVTLTTRRRAEGLAWSHVIFTESNAGVWPTRQRSSGWLPDEHRTLLGKKSRFSLGVLGADDLAWLEKRGLAALARDTRRQVVFSAALADDGEPETGLAPNSWLERVLWRAEPRGGDLQKKFERQVERSPDTVPPVDVASWKAIWSSRRDPARAFDECFLSVDPAKIKPERLPARGIEAAVSDPAELWFSAVLGTSRVEWGPLLRSRKRSVGQLAHRVVAAALRGNFSEGAFFEKPSLAEAQARLKNELARVRSQWPMDRFWDSFHAGLTHVCSLLLANLYTLDTGSVMATEMRLPEGASVAFSAGGCLGVTGRMDVVFMDRAEWAGAIVDVVDFKTGKDAKLSAKSMASKGTALQLGIYLAAAQSLGAKSGRVSMVKPEPGGVASMEMGELPQALVLLERVARHLMTGRYGALTPDKTKHAMGGFDWPLACVPVPAAVLVEKFAVTFGEVVAEAEGNDE
ncbi:MAG: PD-(D/E)XK nuclease family protein [Verrucomicrobia bacterium]|nr:PD-(D/E)XK nuclease family protein [Verrucomicrobiota bacterium]